MVRKSDPYAVLSYEKIELDTSSNTLFNHLFLDKCSGIGGTTEASGPFSEKILEE